MLMEALKFLTDLARLSATPQQLPVKDPRRSLFVVNGVIETVALPEPPRDHDAGSLDDLIALANRFKGVVWYDFDAVVLVIDDGDHRVENATLNLEHSDVFKTLCTLLSGKPKYDQKSFIRLLRIDLAGALDPVVLLNPVRKVKFATDAVSSGQITRQKESLGRDITSRVEADGEIPEEVTLNVPVYKTPGERTPFPVRCSVEVDPAEGTFRLVPLPDELERTTYLAVGSIAARLGGGLDEDVPAYHGKP